MIKNSRIMVLGKTGLLGSSICRELEERGYSFSLFPHPDLTNQDQVLGLFQKYNPEYVFFCAGKVGGILANSYYPADFIHKNIMMISNVVEACFQFGVTKLINFGSSCIYPKYVPIPIKEEYFLTGELEKTNEPYAIAKIAGIKMCSAYNKQYNTNYISLMPSNLYGINDKFTLNNSHVLPALIRKFYEGMVYNTPYVEVWGTGKPMREFTFVDDLAKIAISFAEKVDAKDIGEFVNVGSGEEVSITKLAEIIKKIVGYKGEIVYNTSKPDGTFRKRMDYTKLKLVCNEKMIELRFTNLSQGIKNTYDWFKRIWI